jgi:hypothetical protein
MSASPALVRRLGAIVAVASLLTVVLGLWLGWVSAVVLPRRDPAHVSMWLTVATGFVLFSGLCSALLRAEGRPAFLRGAVLVASLIALALGVYGARDALEAAATGRHFEGYLLLMGVVLSVHGACAFVYAWVRGSAPEVMGEDADSGAASRG